MCLVVYVMKEKGTGGLQLREEQDLRDPGILELLLDEPWVSPCSLDPQETSQV